MRPGDIVLAHRLEADLDFFDSNNRSLPGIHNATRRKVFLEQLIESIRRIKYVAIVRTRKLSGRRADPNDTLFDPLKAAILYQQQGYIEDAYWMVFFFVHFGKHVRAGWRYAREIYGRLGDGMKWDWASTSADPSGFRAWLDTHQSVLKRQGVPGGFGNHRKYESLDAYSPNGTGSVVESYINWVAPPRTHQELMECTYQKANGNKRLAFDYLYESMRVIARFGRLARFDYLTMIGKLSLARIEPGSTYMQGSTGPVDGARILFGTNSSPKTLDRWLVELGTQLRVDMQVLEDALCNWQKNPDIFIPFRG